MGEGVRYAGMGGVAVVLVHKAENSECGVGRLLKVVRIFDGGLKECRFLGGGERQVSWDGYQVENTER